MWDNNRRLSDHVPAPEDLATIMFTSGTTGKSEGVIEAEIYPDYEYAAKKKVKDMQTTLQDIKVSP